MKDILTPGRIIAFGTVILVLVISLYSIISYNSIVSSLNLEDIFDYQQRGNSESAQIQDLSVNSMLRVINEYKKYIVGMKVMQCTQLSRGRGIAHIYEIIDITDRQISFVAYELVTNREANYRIESSKIDPQFLTEQSDFTNIENDGGYFNIEVRKGVVSNIILDHGEVKIIPRQSKDIVGRKDLHIFFQDQCLNSDKDDPFSRIR
jgi:hypothetical protein